MKTNKFQIRSTKQYAMSKIQIFKTNRTSSENCFFHLKILISDLFRISQFEFRIFLKRSSMTDTEIEQLFE